MTRVTVGRWGKNLALRFPNDIATLINLHEGDRVDVEVDADTVTIRRSRPTYTVDDLFAGKSPAEWRALFSDAYDWGPDQGREIIEE